MPVRPLPLLVALSIAATGSVAAQTAEPVLLVLPAGSELAAVDRARSAVPTPIRALLVGEAERVRLKEGIEVLVDRTFATAPPAAVLVLIGRASSRAAEDFLVARRASARAILVPEEHPIGKRLKEEGSGGALILVGEIATIPALLEAVGSAGVVSRAAPRASEPPATSTRAPAASPTAPPTPTPGRPAAKAGVFDRYFSSVSATPAPSPTPRS